MTLQKALPAGGARTAASIRALRETDEERVRYRRRSGWLTAVARSVALPSGIPPGRSRPEPDEIE